MRLSLGLRKGMRKNPHAYMRAYYCKLLVLKEITHADYKESYCRIVPHQPSGHDTAAAAQPSCPHNVVSSPYIADYCDSNQCPHQQTFLPPSASLKRGVAGAMAGQLHAGLGDNQRTPFTTAAPIPSAPPLQHGVPFNQQHHQQHQQLPHGGAPQHQQVYHQQQHQQQHHQQHQQQQHEREGNNNHHYMEDEHNRWMAYQAARRFSGEIHGCYACMPGADVLPEHAGAAVHSPQPEDSSSPNTVNGMARLTAGDASVTERSKGDASGSFAMGSPRNGVTGAPGVRVTPAAPAGAYPGRSTPTSSSGSPGSHTSLSADVHAQVTMGDLESPDVTRSGDTDGTKKAAAGANASLLKTIPESAQLTLQFEGLCGWVPGQVQQPGILKRAAKAAAATCSKKAAQSKPQERQIMFNLTGEVRPGEVLALMGPSGSGKTSLLSVLGGRAPKAVHLAGRVAVNDEPFTKATRRRIGFVLQDDVLYEDLTVHETLSYAALLRLPRELSRAQKLERVEQVIDALGVRKSKNTIIGGFFRRGISGGERKRVSIGHELLINPAILMLDEPTSGLDSTTALHLLQLLEELAAGGRSIATTIHQPSGRLYHKLDKLMLLAEGHMLYYGKAQEVLKWFGKFGYEIPFGINVADYILDISMGEAGYSNTGNTGQAAVKELWTAFESCTRQVDHLRTSGFSASFIDSGACRTCLPAPAAAAAAAAAGGEDPSSNSGRRGHSSAQQQQQQQQRVSFASEAGSTLAVAGSMAADPSSRGQGSFTSGNRSAAVAGSGGVAGGREQAVVVQMPISSSSAVTSPTHTSQAALLAAGGGSSRRYVNTHGAATMSSLTTTEGAPGGVLDVEKRHPGDSGDGVGDGKHPHKERRNGATYWTQVTTLIQRASRVRRFEQLTGQHFFTLFAVAFITGLVWWQRGQNYTLQAASDKLGLLFFMLLFPAMRALFHSLFTIPNELRMLLKERPTGMYKLSAYYLARSAADVPIELLNTLLFVIVTYWFGGLQRDAGCFFGTLFSLLLVVLVAEAWGLLVGAIFFNPKDGQAFTTVIILAMLLVGGYYVRNIPVWISWLRWFSFLYWGYNLLIKSQFSCPAPHHSGVTYYDCATPTPGGGCAPVTDLRSALSLVVDPEDPSYPDVLILLAMLIALRLVVYYVLRRKTRTRQSL